MRTPYTLGERIVYVRGELGITQEQLCESSGLTPQQISAIENGRSNTRTDTVVAIARALGVSTDYLLTGKPMSIEISKLEELSQRLTPKQYHGLQQIIKTFCESMDVDYEQD